MTGNSYPTQKDLDGLALLTEPELIVFRILDLWNTDKGWLYCSDDYKILELHTGGWSGNEDVIEVLEQMEFWYMYWTKSERGGHYYFEVT